MRSCTVKKRRGRAQTFLDKALFLPVEVQRPVGGLTKRNANWYARLLSRAAKSKNLEEGKKVHSILSDNGYDLNPFLGNLVVLLYGSCGLIQDAKQAFDRIKHPDCFSWNIMLAMYGENGMVKEAENMFALTFKDLRSYTSMITAYAKNGQFDKARSLFDMMPGKTPTIWNALFKTYVKSGKMDEAREVYEKIEEKTSMMRCELVRGYCEKGKLMEAREIFDRLHFPRLFAWHSIILTYAGKGQTLEALRLFAVMELQGVHPMINICPLMDSFARYAAAPEAALLHENVIGCRDLWSKDVLISIAMINMHGRCGLVKSAVEVFEQVVELHGQNVDLWVLMGKAFATNGSSNQNVELYRRLMIEGLRAPGRIYLDILYAYCHFGMLYEGMMVFRSMLCDYDTFKPSSHHYACIVELLARCGQLENAMDLLSNIPKEYSDHEAWTAMLSACRIHGASKLGKIAAKRVKELQPKDFTPYTLLTNALNFTATSASATTSNSAKVRPFSPEKKLLGRTRRRRGISKCRN